MTAVRHHLPGALTLRIEDDVPLSGVPILLAVEDGCACLTIEEAQAFHADLGAALAEVTEQRARDWGVE